MVRGHQIEPECNHSLKTSRPKMEYLDLLSGLNFAVPFIYGKGQKS